MHLMPHSRHAAMHTAGLPRFRWQAAHRCGSFSLTNPAQPTKPGQQPQPHQRQWPPGRGCGTWGACAARGRPAGPGPAQPRCCTGQGRRWAGCWAHARTKAKGGSSSACTKPRPAAVASTHGMVSRTRCMPQLCAPHARMPAAPCAAAASRHAFVPHNAWPQALTSVSYLPVGATCTAAKGSAYYRSGK